MGQSCEDIREEIGQSIAGELSIRVHEHIKSCKDCDNYAQKIIRLEKVFRDEGVFTEPAGQSSARAFKWFVMSVAACLILLLPDTYKIDLGLDGSKNLVHTNYAVNIESNVSNETRETELNKYVNNWSDIEQDLWEQIGEAGSDLDSYTESMEVINQWQIDHLDMEES